MDIEVRNFYPDTDVISIEVFDDNNQKVRVCVSRLEDQEVEVRVLKSNYKDGPPTSREIYFLGKSDE